MEHKSAKTIEKTPFLKNYFMRFLHKSEAQILSKLFLGSDTLFLYFYFNFLGHEKHNSNWPSNPYRYRQKSIQIV